ncbi:YegS/Rv2252/BmrU family lipid kinase [Gluconacetobacter diazotrophicus]|uniref:YegS/Rv2252/BmrU family lipid kinase n=1 Tax=Gluconacetobacter diazotrophicus TaxID=33996 RepID=A0A7W4I3Q4_GLUDI|nr:YegS/Rv2252/BmrU family lipid kinase [Gluconacetobacter diazotrophicus]MBB2155328.1 YegS/Rv2252/BmrU family lipid kinase [Gluconacetobacter diazotrophicus]
MRILVIYNPTAGRRRLGRLRQFVRCLEAAGAAVTVAATAHAGHGRILSRAAWQAGTVTHIVAAGGDGTISEVADGLSGSDLTMGVLPLGTANVLAHELGIPFAPADNARALLSGASRTIWPGQLQTGTQTCLFMQMASAGFDAQVVHHVSLHGKRLLGRTAYAVQAIREAGRYDFPPLHVTIDGEACRTFGVVVSKGRFYGGRHVLAPEATPLRRGFSVTLLDAPGTGQMARAGLGLLRDRPDQVPGMRRVRASHIRLIAPACAPVQHDGDASGHLPLVISDAPFPLRIAV